MPLSGECQLCVGSVSSQKFWIDIFSDPGARIASRALGRLVESCIGHVSRLGDIDAVEQDPDDPNLSRAEGHDTASSEVYSIRYTGQCRNRPTVQAGYIEVNSGCNARLRAS
jgi:hypothetical protein